MSVESPCFWFPSATKREQMTCYTCSAGAPPDIAKRAEPAVPTVATGRGRKIRGIFDLDINLRQIHRNNLKHNTLEQVIDSGD